MKRRAPTPAQARLRRIATIANRVAMTCAGVMAVGCLLIARRIEGCPPDDAFVVFANAAYPLVRAFLTILGISMLAGAAVRIAVAPESRMPFPRTDTARDKQEEPEKSATSD